MGVFDAKLSEYPVNEQRIPPRGWRVENVNEA